MVESGKMIFIGFILVHLTLIFARQPGCDERGPICGNDGKTYPTMCQMIWARLEDPDLAVLYEGSCNGKYSPLLAEQSATPADGDYTDYNYGAGSSSGKKLLKLAVKKKTDYEKIRAVMPVGWPPLGPMLLTPARPVLNTEGK